MISRFKIILTAVACLATSLAFVQTSTAAEAARMTPQFNIFNSVGQAPVSRRYMVFFNYDSVTISSVARDFLARIADVIGQGGARSVTLTGHTDTSGSRFYNLGLSQRRAVDVSNMFVKKGVPKRRCKFTSRVNSSR